MGLLAEKVKVRRIRRVVGTGTGQVKECEQGEKTLGEANCKDRQ